MHEIHKHPDAFEVRPCGPRTYRPLRQRARTRFGGDASKEQSTRWTGEERMEEEAIPEPAPEPGTEDLIDRATLCLPDFDNDSIVHGGDEGFRDVLRQYFPTAESNATERLVALKSKLRTASTYDFWGVLMEEMCDITGSQCGFVAKRMLVDDQDSAVEMPELGEPGSCLMGVAFYLNNGSDVKEMYRDYRYHAYGTPCAYMRHDKVFIVPERLSEFLPNNPNAMPWKQSEAFMGLPLFAGGKCFAHFGMIWNSDGAAKRRLSWSFLEMFMHSLEDMILQRILEGKGFAKEVSHPDSKSAKIIPLSAITASQSLKPYARSLSHELRTPMQGVVGMLDIMYSTVVDAIANQQSERVRAVFKDLKNHIEVVQDSSKRAVEAADNVVHAYDLNMQMPETPLTPQDEKYFITPKADLSSNTLAPPTQTGTKRERSETLDFHPGPPLKRMFTMTESELLQSYYQGDSTMTTLKEPIVTMLEDVGLLNAMSNEESRSQQSTSERRGSPLISPAMMSPAHRRIVTRDFMSSLVTDILRNEHPISEKHTPTPLGETIEFDTLGSRGEVQERTIHLNIESDVPEAIITEEQHLQFSLQKVIDNAIKFTESGSITITMKLGRNSPVVEIWVVDTGCGIAEESKSSLFKPHFQEDASISRSRDGLGLSLFNAKAHVRKRLGGDVTLERSDTEGPARGSEFLIRLPISTLETGSPDTPLVGTPTPSGPPPRRPSPMSYSIPSSSESIKTNSSLSATTIESPPKRATINTNLGRELPLNILIAEDNAINRNVAVGSLNKLGYSKDNITVAFDGVEAVRRYEESLTRPSSEHFDAVLMDIWMPNMDGYEATAKILDLAKLHGEKIAIVAVTADITEDSVERAKEVGMQGFLAKPYKVLDIEHLIVEHFTKV